MFSTAGGSFRDKFMHGIGNILLQARLASGFGLLNIEARTETDSRLLVLLRCVLAVSAFAIVAAPSVANQPTAFSYGALLAYFVFSLILAIVWQRRNWPMMPRALHWIDLLFYVYLVAITGSTESYFVLFFFYPILVSSFSWGFREGVLVTLVSTVLFATQGLVTGQTEYSRTLIPACGLLLFGYVISYLGVYEHLLRSRLALLKEINNPWNPRFGADYVNAANLDRILEFYQAGSCVLILRRRRSIGSYVMYTATAGKLARAEMPRDVGSDVVEALSRLPETLGAYYHDPEGPWWMRYRGYSAFDFDLESKTNSFREDCAVWINLLDTSAFVTVPYANDGTTGRIFLTKENGNFNQSDIEFLAQVSDAMATVIENIYLLEELIAGAAESERLAMSRDLHDTTIQPYIGLKLALDGLYREAGENNPLAPRISDLIEMSDMTIRDLRNYAATLKDNSLMAGEFLMDAIAKQVERLRRFYGIDVRIKSEISEDLKGRLAAETFQIIAEGLSNVLRHTAAKNAFVNVRSKGTSLLIEIGNEAEDEVPAFIPRSIFERARALGGNVLVERRPDHFTVVHVTVPI